MADKEEKDLSKFQSVDWIRGLLGENSGQISIVDLLSFLNRLSTNIDSLRGEDNMNDLRNTFFWYYPEAGIPQNASTIQRASGISLVIGTHGFQITTSTYGGSIACRSTYTSGLDWSPWMYISFT